MKFIVSIAAFLFLAFELASQLSSIPFIPKEYQTAYNNQSRMKSGLPGRQYFQNRSDYKIEADFEPQSGTLTGMADITYYNNSPDSLHLLKFHLFQDFFKKGNKRDWDIGEADINDGVHIERLQINGTQYDLNSKKIRRNSGFLTAELYQAIEPDDKAEIRIEWEFTVAKETPVRMGKYGEDNYFIAYWFPKIAVYDDIFGWNRTPFSGMHEFYHEFGNYEVKISLPGIYNAWASGVHQNPEAVFSEKILKRLEKAKKSDRIVHIIKEKDREKLRVTQTADTHTWEFKSENAPDFAFAVSKSYLWDGTRADNGTDEGVFVNAVYKKESPDFPEVCEISKNSVEFFSKEVPAIPFPYPQLTAFNGLGGMEFPAMINDGDMPNRNATLYVTAHEVGHSYFPFASGLNEQKYAWMDEGLISFIPRLFTNQYTDEKNYDSFSGLFENYNRYACSVRDLPLGILTDNIGNYRAYRQHSYTRSGLMFYVLYNYLGKEAFNKALQNFYKHWESKHPTHFDFIACLKAGSDEEISPIIDPWVFKQACADFSLRKSHYFDRSGELVIKKEGELPAPAVLTVEYKNGKSKDFSFGTEYWISNNPGEPVSEQKFKVPDIEDARKVYINNKKCPDANPDNNLILF